MAECNRLKAEVERYQHELESVCGNCHKLEADNAQLLERIGSFEHQQVDVSFSFVFFVSLVFLYLVKFWENDFRLPCCLRFVLCSGAYNC